MEKPTGISRVRRATLAAGIASLLISSLPWVGLGEGYYFGMPRLNLCDLILIDIDRKLYRTAAIPLELVAQIPDMDGVVYFPGEGVATVRPIAVFWFYFISGAVLVWVALRVFPRPVGESTPMTASRRS